MLVLIEEEEKFFIVQTVNMKYLADFLLTRNNNKSKIVIKNEKLERERVSNAFFLHFLIADTVSRTFAKTVFNNRKIKRKINSIMLFFTLLETSLILLQFLHLIFTQYFMPYTV